MASFATFTYNGSDTLQAVCSGLAPTTSYSLFSNDPDSSVPSGTSDGTGNLTLTITNIGGLAAGNTFFFYVVNNSGPATFICTSILKYGTPSSSTNEGIAVTWAYNGSNSVSVTYPSINGVGYELDLTTGAGGSYTSASTTGDGSTQTLTISDVSTTATFQAFLWRTDTGDQLQARIFAVGVSGGGFDGIGPPPTPPTGDPFVWIAFGFDTYDTAATFTGIAVQGFTIDRGRQYELDKTQAGTASVTVLDTDGRYDPNNPSGPFYGMIGPLLQAYITGINPVDSSTVTLFTGFVESWTYVPNITQKWMVLTINLTDAFEPLTRAELVPDPTDTTTLQPQQVDDRIRLAEADFNPSPSSGSPSGAGWPPAWEQIASGNADMQGTIYNPQTTILSVMQDAADAEFPNVANVYINKQGWIQFHGRWARFTPESIHDFYGSLNFWQVGDRNAAYTFDLALIADLEWIVDLKNVINACLCVPFGLAESNALGAIQDQMKTNPGSITTYGARLLSIPDLLVESSVAGLTADSWQASHAYTRLFVVKPTAGYSSSKPSLFYARNAGTSGSSEPIWPTSSDQTVMDGTVEWGVMAPGGDGANQPRSDTDNTGQNECKIFGQYYVDNYATPVPMISKIEFHSRSADDELAAAHWAFLLGVEIGDVVTVNETNVGGGGFKDTGFFVEGVHYQVKPLDGGLLDYTLQLDLSPRAWYRKFNGVTYYTGT